MKIAVKVHPKSKAESVIQTGEENLELHFNVVPQKGKANAKVIEMIADYFGVPKSEVKIIGGLKSTQKIVELP